MIAVLGLSVLIGLALGLLGGGGSILTVPILVYAAGLDAKAAIATSLLVVGVTSAAAAVAHARAGRVRWRTGLLFGAAGMAGAYGGGRLGALIPGSWLLTGFGILMLATAVAMIRGRKQSAGATHGELPALKIVAEGVVVGVVTGLVGAGGGFLVVPALVLFGGLPMDVAVGTSLLVIAMKSGAGVAGYLHSVSIDWGLALGVTTAALIGSGLGARLAGRVDNDLLRKGFGWFVAAMAVFVVGQQLPPEWRAAFSDQLPRLLTAAVAVGAGALFVLRRRRPATESHAAAVPQRRHEVEQRR